MSRLSGLKITLALIVGLSGTGLASGARAGDFLSDLFGALSGGRPPAPPPPSTPLPYGGVDDEAQPAPASPAARPSGGGRVAYCVRICDGRYFPLPAAEGESRATACASFCPASETKVVYGGSIDTAATEAGKSYSALPNAFRYRNEMVAGCTCNGRDAFGLAAIGIDDDRTLRKGDIVAGPNGLVVASGRVNKHTAANFTPASPVVHARFSRVPVVAQE